MNNDYRYENRKFVIVGIVIAIVAVFIGRLFSLQILSDDYKKHADSNAFLNKTVYPSRGVMYDRTGKLLVSNQPVISTNSIRWLSANRWASHASTSTSAWLMSRTVASIPAIHPIQTSCFSVSSPQRNWPCFRSNCISSRASPSSVVPSVNTPTP